MTRKHSPRARAGRPGTGPEPSTGAEDTDVPAGFQFTHDPATPPRGGRTIAQRPARPGDVSWDPEDPTRRRPGVEADRLGAGFDPASVGDETGDASSPRPDENVADEIGQETGVPVQDEEVLEGSIEKVSQRDEQRWELNPASSEDYPERAAEQRGEEEEPPAA